MTITGTTTTFPGKKRGDFANKFDLRKNERVVYIEPTLTTPLNFNYAIPVMITSEANKYVNLKEIVIKAAANTALTSILGFVKIADRDPSLFFKAGEPVTIFAGAEAYNQFYALIKTGETIVAGDLLEFVPADNTYAKVTTGVGCVKALEAGAGGDIIAVQPLV